MFAGGFEIQVRAFLHPHFIADDLKIVRATFDLIAELLSGIFIGCTQGANNGARGRIFGHAGPGEIYIRGRLVDITD